jgi:hypothetical protein
VLPGAVRRVQLRRLRRGRLRCRGCSHVSRMDVVYWSSSGIDCCCGLVVKGQCLRPWRAYRIPVSLWSS